MKIIERLQAAAPKGVDICSKDGLIRAEKGGLSWGMSIDLFRWDGNIDERIIELFTEITERVFSEGDCGGGCRI